MKPTLERQPHPCLPLTFSGWDEVDCYGDMQMYNVVFLEDFGPFKKGETVNSLVRLDSKGLLQEYCVDGAKGRECQIVYVVKPA